MPTFEALPHVDEHETEVDVAADAVWGSLLAVLERSFSAAGPRPLAAGSALSGFHVETARAPRELALRGSHRFSDYALIFRLDDLGPGHTRLRAETRATFPGLHGRAYRALVIGTRGHVLVTRRLLGAVKSRAERD